MLERLRSSLRRRRNAGEAKRRQEAEEIAEAGPARAEHEQQKLSGRGAQPITPKHKW